LFRDGYMCCVCGFTDGKLHVHHIKPFHSFGYIPNKNDNYLLANELDNLITLCPSCHQKVEKGSILDSELRLAQFPPML
jgi:DEAD/DEAH box helicase domain-containing protein